MWYSSSSTGGDREDPGLLSTGTEITMRSQFDSMHTMTTLGMQRERKLLVDLCCGDQVEDRFGHGESQSMQTRREMKVNCL